MNSPPVRTSNTDAPFGVVVNPRSARGRGARAAKKVLAALKSAGYSSITIIGKDAAHCQTLVREACADGSVRGLILVGGDGIISLVLQVPEARNTPIGIVPAGSGNDFARQFSLSGKPRTAINRIIEAQAKPRRVDLGVVSFPGTPERYFAGALNVGFDAATNARANAIKLPIGPLRYSVALIMEIMTLKERWFTVRAGAVTRSYSGLLATVMNTSTIGGGVPLAPRAKIDDGKLDLVEVRNARKLRVLSVLGLLARGKSTLR